MNNYNNTMYKLYFDGSNRSSQLGCSGCVIYKVKDNQETRVYSESKTLSEDVSCNVAEYEGLVLGLEWLKKNKKNTAEIVVFGDSQLVIKQMFGKWKIKNGFYKRSALRAKNLLMLFDKITGVWIPRQENKEADTLSKKYV